MRIRWSDRDRYFGPFTYARDSQHYHPIAVMLGSGDDDDYPGCRLRLSGFGHTLIIALPAITRPWRVWIPIRTEPTRSQMIAAGREPGYWDTHAREYGFSLVESALHLHYGPQTHDSETTKSKCFFMPWRQWRHIGHRLYDHEGYLFAIMPVFRRGLSHEERRNQWTVEEALRVACPTWTFHFLDYDGEEIAATCRIEEREWKIGEGSFKWLSLFRRNKISRSLDLKFSSEVGRRKGSWKGGTVGHSIDMLPGELHEAAFRRYCANQNLTFVEVPSDA